jgi:hypothetical protein
MTGHRAPPDPAGPVQLSRAERAALHGLHLRLAAADAAWAAWVDGREPRGWRRLKAPVASICSGLRELGAMWTLLAVSRTAPMRKFSP